MYNWSIMEELFFFWKCETNWLDENYYWLDGKDHSWNPNVRSPDFILFLCNNFYHIDICNLFPRMVMWIVDLYHAPQYSVSRSTFQKGGAVRCAQVRQATHRIHPCWQEIVMGVLSPLTSWLMYWVSGTKSNRPFHLSLHMQVLYVVGAAPPSLGRGSVILLRELRMIMTMALM